VLKMQKQLSQELVPASSRDLTKCRQQQRQQLMGPSQPVLRWKGTLRWQSRQQGLPMRH
jgi:hypothetical protein